MNYIEISIETSSYGIEVISAKLLTMGITDIVIDDPRDVQDIMGKKEDYEWDYIEDDVIENLDRNPKVMIYMEDNEENRRLAENVSNAMADLLEDSAEGLSLGTLKVVTKYEDDTLWKDKWKEFFKPAEIAPGIVVKPTWEEYNNKDDKKVIEIDPGMAFGTGTHETTSLCVRCLEKYMKDGAKKVLDVGTGSGILLIASILLGAEDALGIDIDPIAVEVAEENLKKNGIDSRARAIEGDLTKGVDYKADIVVANLMADLVMMLSKDVKKHLKNDGIFISSGVLLEKEEIVKKAIVENGFHIVEVIRDGEWCAIVARSC